MTLANSPESILKLLIGIWQHLSCRRRRQFWLVAVLMLVGGLMEIISLGAVLPFLGILIAPDKVFNHPLTARLIQDLGFTSADQLILPLTIAFFIAVLVTGVTRTFLFWGSNRFACAAGTDISVDVYQRTLYQPYSTHISRNSSELISGIVSKIDRVVMALNHLLILFSSVVSQICIISTLIAIDPVVAAIAAGSFGFSYGLITWYTRHRLEQNSLLVAREKNRVVKILQEGLGCIRDVLLDGSQPVYCKTYRRADYSLRLALASNEFIAGIPRIGMETLGIILITALAFGLSGQERGLAAALPTLGALALGAQRLLPALQQGYSALSYILGNRASIANIVELLNQPLPPEKLRDDIAPLKFQSSINFDNVRFRYNSQSPWILDGINLTIPKGSRVGFVGSTGSGKSTSLDLLMGLLLPNEGALMVDGLSIRGENVGAWQRTIAHVPQSIYLVDSTIVENIAFGVPLEYIDMDKVKEAARKAQIADFIESRQEGYNALVGERGISLSGGQRQRIGIARALYKEASILIFDEATSALDDTTERLVMKALEELNRDLTVLIIAHRLTTVRYCDIIIELEQGKVVAQGTYEQLHESSPSFQKMIKSAEKIV
jgi:ATP-binding cassette, subfamily B, bacterial PglK